MSVGCEASPVAELVGVVEAGVLAAAWSPDEEVLVLVTAANTIMTMTPGLEVLNEVRTSPGPHEAGPDRQDHGMDDLSLALLSCAETPRQRPLYGGPDHGCLARRR